MTFPTSQSFSGGKIPISRAIWNIAPIRMKFYTSIRVVTYFIILYIYFSNLSDENLVLLMMVQKHICMCFSPIFLFIYWNLLSGCEFPFEICCLRTVFTREAIEGLLISYTLCLKCDLSSWIFLFERLQLMHLVLYSYNIMQLKRVITLPINFY